MAVTLVDLVRDVRDSIYSFVQVKDYVAFLNADINDSVTTFVTSSNQSAQAISRQPGAILQFSTDASAQAELMRVKSVDTATNTVTVQRAVMGTTAASWTSADTEIRIDPEFPIPNIVREINREITSLPPNIWSVATATTTVNSDWLAGYSLPAAAVGIIEIRYLPVASTDKWEKIRRWRFDPVNKDVNILAPMDFGQALKITYRAYPVALADDGDNLTDAGLEDQLAELIQMGATYRLISKRAPGRIVDSRAETPMNQQYRQADPVNAAVRQLYAMYQQRLQSERERQRLLYPSPLFYTI